MRPARTSEALALPAPCLTPDRRVAPRAWRLQAGRISTADGDISLRCLIVDMSETGARVRIEHTLHLPTRFYLVDPRDHAVYKAQLVRSAEPEYGLALIHRYRFSWVDRPELTVRSDLAFH